MSLPSQDLEELRQDAERLASQLPQSSSKDEALEIAIKAAETSMRALKLLSDPTEKAHYTARARALMLEAEQIKNSADWREVIQQRPEIRKSTPPRSAGPVRVLKEPVSTRELPTREKIIKLKSGFLNGVKFPEWTGPPVVSEFALKDGEGLFVYVSLCLLSITFVCR